jgi:lipopolysaccharide transport protein LptA
MKKFIALALILACASGAGLRAQTAVPTPNATPALPKAVAVAPKAVAAPPAEKTKKAKKPKKEATPKENSPKENKAPANSLFGQSAMGLNTNEPTTTEIYADEAFFDSTKNMGIFSGRVKVTDPRFNLQSDKLTVFITKGENQGLEKAIAEGNVGLVRDRPDPSGGPPTRAVGRADKATYVAATGDVELRGTPRVQEGPNMHVATSPDTVMIINQNSQLTTHGPSRTEIRQEPSDDAAKQKKREAKKAAAGAAPSQSVPVAATPTPTP